MEKFINFGLILYPRLMEVCPTYPLVAENTAKFPFCVYKMNAVRPQETKDGIYGWIYTVQINIVSDRYDSVCSLTGDMVDKILELEDTFDINIESIGEDYVDDAYVREIYIKIKL